jgi:hypothetical protein
MEPFLGHSSWRIGMDTDQGKNFLFLIFFGLRNKFSKHSIVQLFSNYVEQTNLTDINFKIPPPLSKLLNFVLFYFISEHTDYPQIEKGGPRKDKVKRKEESIQCKRKRRK